MSASLDAAREVLRTRFGHGDFRRGQIDVVIAVLAGRDTLGVLPTGGGKSLCYQVPALLRPGTTIVVSPLISLMKDQVDRLAARGIPAAYLNSSLAPAHVSEVLERLASGHLKLLYVAPERLESEDLRRPLRRVHIAALAVDEAHCISEWGHDFRPSFRRIARMCRDLGRPQIVALTATATPEVRADIMRQLVMRRPAVIVSGFDRPNLRYAARSNRSDDEKDAVLSHAIARRAGSAIVYASTRSTVERLARLLRRLGTDARPYHAGLDAPRRREAQDAFMAATGGIIVATNAFGMGIDKPDVRLVVHYAMPGTLESYYQEAGRAGRDGAPADCLLLHAIGDRSTHEWFIRGMYPERDIVERVFRAARATAAGDHALNLRRREEQAALRLLVREGLVIPAQRTSRLYVSLLATPSRIRRELGASDHDADRALLATLWPTPGADESRLIDVRELPPGMSGRAARASLTRLRDRQFVHFVEENADVFSIREGISGDALPIDWAALQRRRSHDWQKLDMMERYARTSICRRAFMLGYFGDRARHRRCQGCDNCL